MNKKKLEPQDIEEHLKDITDPALRDICRNLGNTMLSNDVEELKQEIINSPAKPEQQIFSFLPHQMAKISVFFPMSDKELKEENRKIIQKIEHETGWGRLVVEGIKLAIFEEDILLALLKLSKHNFKTDNGLYYIETSMQEIIKLLYGRTGYNKRNIDRIEAALRHFQLVRFEISTYTHPKKGKERIRQEHKRSIGNIVERYDYNSQDKKLVIFFNPHFFAFFLESMLTNINFTLRRKLKKDGSKALLRFISTHTNPSKMHMLTILNAINFNTNQPLYRLRSRFKEFIKELKNEGVLGPKTKMYDGDQVFLDILPQKQQISE